MELEIAVAQSEFEDLPQELLTRAPISDDNLPNAVAQLGSRLSSRRQMQALTIAGDVLAIVVACLIAGTIRFGNPFHEQVWNVVSVILPVYMVVALNQRAFHAAAVTNALTGVKKAMLAFAIALSVVGLAVFFLKVSENFSRAVFGAGALMSALLIPVARFSLARVTLKIVGTNPLNEIIIEDDTPAFIADHAIRLCARKDMLSPRMDDPMMLDRIGRSLRFADRVIVSCPPERRSQWAATLKGAGVRAEVFAPELEALGAIELAQHEGRSTIVVSAEPLGLFDCMLKRAFDITMVILSAPFTVPIMVAVAIAIKLDSPGPVFFRQQRVGLSNCMFHMYKFRSMYTEKLDGAGHRSTGRDDDRITRVGRFIRKTSLDELPQVLNVLQGAMGIVGPRPHALGSRADDQLFWDIDLNYWHRHAVKPGMTGLAQIRGYRGATTKADDLRNRLQADLEYLSGWSVWRDIWIVLATFRVMVHRNAF